MQAEAASAEGPNSTQINLLQINITSLSIRQAGLNYFYGVIYIFVQHHSLIGSWKLYLGHWTDLYQKSVQKKMEVLYLALVLS